MINFDDFSAQASQNRLETFVDAFRRQLKVNYFDRIHGDYPAWSQAYSDLPQLQASSFNLSTDSLQIGLPEEADSEQRRQLAAALQGLHPWRKGPFNFFGVQVDTEWRSDWKWRRVAPHISDLKKRFVLDVGCGSGYHCWRMFGEGAEFVLGIDPSPKFVFQFQCVKKLLPIESENLPVHYLPLKSEDLPTKMGCFDTVFSMGVLYHRRALFDHLDELKGALRPGGELVLETLVIPGDEHSVLLPRDRYSKMRNVWMIGSPDATALWLERAGFKDVRIVDVTVTTTEEQRTTEWMRFHSLSDFLDPEDKGKTIEGYPAPTRAVLVARKP